MGMDVYGKKPTADSGEYFRRSWWGWRPLWDACAALAPELIGPELHRAGHYNDGAGLDGPGSVALAKALRTKLEDGSVGELVAKRSAALKELPDEQCDICAGTGTRKDMVVPNGCNKCQGAGHVRPVDTWYSLDATDVAEFAEFLEHCGGFEMY